MAGAYAALSDDFSAAFYNPAGLSQIRDKHVATFGYVRSFANLGLVLDPAPGATPYQRKRLAELERELTDPEPTEAWILGLTLNFFDRSHFGMAIHMPTKWLNRNESFDATYPRYFLWQNRSQVLKPCFGGSVKILDSLSIGGGVALYEDVAGNIQIPLEIDSSNFGKDPDNLEGGIAPPMQIELSQPIDLQALAGIQYRPSRYFRTGISYRGVYALEAKARFDISVRLNNLAIDLDLLKDLFPYTLNVVIDIPGLGSTEIPVRILDLEGELIVDALLPITGEFVFTELWTPQELTWGVASDPIEPLTLCFDLTWCDWSEMVPPGTAFPIEDIHVNARLLPSVVKVLADVSLPVVGVVNLPPVELEIPDLEIPVDLVFATPELPKPVMRDTWVPRFGAEYRLPRFKPLGRSLDIALRCGYSYMQSPLEAQRGITNLFDNDRHLITGGFGIMVAEFISFDASMQWHRLVEREHNKVMPDPIYGFYRVKTAGDMFALNLGLSVKF